MKKILLTIFFVISLNAMEDWQTKQWITVDKHTPSANKYTLSVMQKELSWVKQEIEACYHGEKRLTIDPIIERWLSDTNNFLQNFDLYSKDNSAVIDTFIDAYAAKEESIKEAVAEIQKLVEHGVITDDFVIEQLGSMQLAPDIKKQNKEKEIAALNHLIGALSTHLNISD